jgi:hypothetical protein
MTFDLSHGKFPGLVICAAKPGGGTDEPVLCLERRSFEFIKQGTDRFYIVHLQLSFHDDWSIIYYICSAPDSAIPAINDHSAQVYEDRPSDYLC